MSRKQGLSLPPVEDVDRILYGIRDMQDAALLWLYRNGLRCSEAIGLRCSDLFRDNGTVIARVRGKGDKTRDVPLFKPAAYAIWLAVEGDEWPKEHDRYIITTYVRPQMGRTTAWDRSIKLTGQHPHTLRHIYATHLVNNGVSLPLVMDLMGHESIATTMIYYHTTREQLIEATKSVGI